MKTLLCTLALLGFLPFSVFARGELINIEEAIEAASVNPHIDGKLHGYISVNPCDKCKWVKLKVTPETLAEHQGKRVHLNQVNSLGGKPATVVYDVKTRTAVKIIW